MKKNKKKTKKKYSKKNLGNYLSRKKILKFQKREKK